MRRHRVIAAATAAFVTLTLSVHAFAQDAEGDIADASWGEIAISIGGGFLQLLLGIALAVASITLGLRVVDRVLPEVKIADELKKKNIAVGFMTAGVVIAYTKVISTAIAQIGESIAVDPSFTAFGAGLFNLLVGLAVASIGVTWAFKALAKVIPGVNLGEEMNNDNRAIGLFVAGVLFGLSEMIAAGVAGIGPVLAGALDKVF